MKKLAKKLNFALIGLLVSSPAFAAGITDSGICQLITQMQSVFKILRTLAFVGAAFYIAGWAWGYITAGDAKMDDLKKKGIGLLVGFFLLFGIGFVLTAITSSAGMTAIGCASQLSTGW